MSNQDKLFNEELARRNPDWEKIVSVHNAAIKDLNKQLAAERAKLKGWSIKLNYDPDQLRQQIAAERRTAFQAQEMAKEINGKLDIAIKAFKEIATEDVMNEASYVVGVAAATLKKIGGKE